MKDKLNNSNKYHEKLMVENTDVFMNSNKRTPTAFMSMVVANYHGQVLKKQVTDKRLLTKNEKQKLFNKSYGDIIKSFENVNKDYSIYEKWYVPKKGTYHLKNKNGVWMQCSKKIYEKEKRWN